MSKPREPNAVVEAAPSYAGIVRRQFLKNRPAVVALLCVLVLIVVATAAPLVTMNLPYLLVTDAGWEFPLFERLFDRFVFESGVDIFFNLLLVLAPVWLLGAALCRALGWTGRPPDRRRASLCGAGLGLIGLLYLAFAMGERSLFGYVLIVGLAGLAVQIGFARRARGRVLRERRRLLVRGRFALLAVFVGAFVLTVSTLHDTRTTVAYRDVAEELRANGEDWFWLTPPVFYHPDNVGEAREVKSERSLKPPSLEHRNLLGTDIKGRDIFARLLFGTRISLTIGLIAVSIYGTIGVILGSLAGYFGRWIDAVITMLLQIMLCIPGLFLLLTIIAVFDTRSIFMIMLAIGLTAWPGITRLVRGEFLRQKNIEYVMAAKALGIPERRIIFGHVLKNALAPVLVAAAFGIAGAILAESFLSFLGLGDADAPSWGQILREGRQERKMWLILSPGLAIFFTVTVLNIVGDGLRDALDPKLRQ